MNINAGFCQSKAQMCIFASVEGTCCTTDCVLEPRLKTNADHIRTMTDEELAELLYSRLNVDAEQIPFCKGGAKCETMLANEVEIPASMCQECMLKWLREPWEGGDT